VIRNSFAWSRGPVPPDTDPDADAVNALLPERLARPLLEYAEQQNTTARAVISEAVSAYLGFSA